MKNTIKLLVIVFMIASFGLASTVTAQEWTKEQQEVWSSVSKGWEQWQQGDLDGSLSGFHEKYHGWNQEDPLPTNKSKLTRNWKMMSEIMEVNWYDIEPARITVYEDVAVVNYYFEMYSTMTWGGEKTERHSKGKNTEFLLKEKGKWLLIGDMTYFTEGGPGDGDDEDDD